MDGLLPRLGLLVVGAGLTWLVILVSRWSRRPRLRLCFDRDDLTREAFRQLGRTEAEAHVWGTHHEVIATVRNLGHRPATDCVGRLGWCEEWDDGAWRRMERRPPAELAWGSPAGGRTATVRPTAGAPPRHLRVLSFPEERPGFEVAVLYAEEAPERNRHVFEPPGRYRFEVWVQPEGVEGAAASGSVEVSWREDPEDLDADHGVEIRVDPTCDEPPGWRERAVALLTLRVW